MLATSLNAFLAHKRFADAMAPGMRHDFDKFFLPAAQAVAAGHSPYEVEGYVYSPVVAWLLAPIADRPDVTALWTAVLITLALASCALLTWASGPLHPAWSAVVFALAGLTMLSNWAMTVELWAGQTQSLVLFCLAVTAAATRAGRHGVAGIGLGLAAAVKSWPVMIALWMLRRPLSLRFKSWIGFLAGGLVVVASAMPLGGPAVLADMLFETGRYSAQPLAAYSVWGAGTLLFSETVVGTPVLVSPTLRIVTTGILLVVVLALLALVLIRPGNPVLALFNVILCVLLLIPVSHFGYLILGIPVLWLWAARLIREPRSRSAWLATIGLLAWWLVAVRRIPAGDGTARTTWQSLVIVFGATLLATALSVVLASVSESSGEASRGGRRGEEELGSHRVSR